MSSPPPSTLSASNLRHRGGAPTIACRPRRHRRQICVAFRPALSHIHAMLAAIPTVNPTGKTPGDPRPTCVRPPLRIHTLTKFRKTRTCTEIAFLASGRPLDAPTQVGRFPDKTKGSQQSKKGGTLPYLVVIKFRKTRTCTDIATSGIPQKSDVYGNRILFGPNCPGSRVQVGRFPDAKSPKNLP